MSADEINKAIAESVGWVKDMECLDHDENETLGWRNPKGQGPFGDCYLPNYHGSLDAIVPVVRALKPIESSYVISILLRIAIISHWTHLATPAQWCEAYLKAKGLWHE